jgi:hypothetical protein
MKIHVPPWLRPFHAVPYHRIPWRGGADWRSRYPEDDEGCHAGTWTYRKDLVPTTSRHFNGVRAVLHISSDFKARHRPVVYSLSVEFSRVSISVCHASCTTVTDAKAHANRVCLYEAVRQILRRVYNKDRARCVFCEDGTPLMSVFDDLYGWRDGLTGKHYYDIDPVSHYRVRATHHTEMWGSGYCAGSVPNERQAFAATLVPWT